MCFEIYSDITSKASFDIEVKVKMKENGTKRNRDEDNMHGNETFIWLYVGGKEDTSYRT